ncbi:hypothetical protein GWI33_016708 [Rhynchophorus ferrugineus]|uniref:Uncharacterized protein n=1 Tax=Rhynchophorus ferrugineus TaxID=354439 RepID=A0A834I0M1_RHYFE|nr:hypothetical protein GWI33_016708 [Rhynchophorus ferrugineus]
MLESLKLSSRVVKPATLSNCYLTSFDPDSTVRLISANAKNKESASSKSGIGFDIFVNHSRTVSSPPCVVTSEQCKAS